MSRSAAATAERAEVGLRSVFRHFEDLDTLLRELMLLSYDEITLAFMAPCTHVSFQISLLVKRNRTTQKNRLCKKIQWRFTSYRF